MARDESRVLPKDPRFTLQISHPRIRDNSAAQNTLARNSEIQLIDISTVGQPKSNNLKCAKSGQDTVVKEMIISSLSLPFSFSSRQLFASLLLSRLPNYLRTWNRLCVFKIYGVTVMTSVVL